jgi:acyl carrier protein
VTKEKIIAKIRNIVAERLNVEQDQVTLATSFMDDLGADSLDLVDLVAALEEGFGFSIPEKEAERLTTVGAAAEYILSRL